MQLSIGNKIFTATLEDNSSAESFYALLPTTLEMNELNGNEKYNYLETTLPVNSIRPGTINAGDIMLYGDNCIHSGVLRNFQVVVQLFANRTYK